MNKINDVKKVSIIGIICNTILIVIKLTVGLISRSQSMIADSIHSIEDAISSILSYIGARFTEKESDISHPYGHGKIEYVFSFIIAITMIISAFTMLKSSIFSIFKLQNFEFSYWLIIVCIVNIILKLLLFIYTRFKYNKTKDILIKASMEDHRNDMFLTSSTLIGVTCGYFNIYIVDSIIGIIISFWILYIGVKLFISSYKVLIDTNLTKLEIDNIKEIFINNTNILQLENIIAKPIGDEYLVIIRVNLKEDISLKEIKKEMEEVKYKLKNRFSYICDIIIDLKY